MTMRKILLVLAVFATVVSTASADEDAQGDILEGFHSFDVASRTRLETALTGFLDTSTSTLELPSSIREANPEGPGFARILVESAILNYETEQLRCTYRLVAANEKEKFISDPLSIYINFSEVIELKGDLKELGALAEGQRALRDGVLDALQIELEENFSKVSSNGMQTSMFAKLSVLSVPNGAFVTVDREEYSQTDTVIHFYVTGVLTVDVAVRYGEKVERYTRVLKKGEDAKPVVAEFNK